MMHAHLLEIVTVEQRRSPATKSLELLDAGCGDGRFLELASLHLPARLGRSVSGWGFDVHDDKVQVPGFLNAAISRLSQLDLELSWEERLHLISKSERWPFEDASFDVIVSNQVGEHLFDIDRFFSETARTLKPGGVSVNLFPLVNYLAETHVGVPLAHWLRSHDALVSYLRLVARLGLSRFGPLKRDPSTTVEEFAESRADYVQLETCYRSWTELKRAANRAGLRISYRYTPELYLLKLGRVMGADFSAAYARRRHAVVEAALFNVLKRVSSVTVFLERTMTYDPERHAVARCGGGHG